MERRLRKWAGCGLLVVLASAGCRSMHSSVPPGPKFSPDGRQQPSVGFSNDAHAPNQVGNPALNPMANMAPGGSVSGLSGAPQVGTPGVNGGNFGVPAGAAYGQPGTSGAAPSLNPGASAGGAAGLPSGLPGTN
ncbi:MAG: hypothetical protein P4L84_15500 [Isosphaeraceae bacterium]|nr:hypothetical protein [Isosphaeraceae bacterium]